MYASAPVPGTVPYNPCNILSVESTRGIFFSIEVTLGVLLDGGWSPERPSHDYNLEFLASTPTPHFSKKGRGTGTVLMINHGYGRKLP